MNRLLVVIGLALVLVGVGWSWFKRVPIFRLPGDIVIDRPRVKMFVPITTMIIVSAVVSLLVWLARR